MSSRARYPPPGMGGGRGGGGGGMNPHMGPNPNFQPRNMNQQYVQRSQAQNNQNNQLYQNPQPQQWLRRAPADSTVDEVEKTVQSEAVDSRSIFFFILCVRTLHLLGTLHLAVLSRCFSFLIFEIKKPDLLLSLT